MARECVFDFRSGEAWSILVANTQLVGLGRVPNRQPMRSFTLSPCEVFRLHAHHSSLFPRHDESVRSTSSPSGDNAVFRDAHCRLSSKERGSTVSRQTGPKRIHVPLSPFLAPCSCPPLDRHTAPPLSHLALSWTLSHISPESYLTLSISSTASLLLGDGLLTFHEEVLITGIEDVVLLVSQEAVIVGLVF